MDKFDETLFAPFDDISDMEKAMTGKQQTKIDEEKERKRFMGKDALWNIPQPQSLSFRVCTKPLSSLRRTTVQELRVNEPAEGTYLLLRTLEVPFKTTHLPLFGHNALVLTEDQEKELTVCCMYGYVYPDTKDYLPIHTVLALKEPLLKACSPEDFVVVVGNPSDLIIVGQSHAFSKYLEELGWRSKPEGEGTQLAYKWKAIGNHLYKEGKYSVAIDAYLFALQNIETEISIKFTLHMNLSVAYLSTGYFESSLKQAVKALEIQPGNETALYRVGRAHYELRQYEEAKRYFQQFVQANPSNKKAEAELARCEQRLKEKEGYFDVYKLYRTCLDSPLAAIDHSDYIGPIQARLDSNKRRGVFATEDIKPGTLILVEKPVASVSDPSEGTEFGLERLAQLVTRVVLKNPKTVGKRIYSLPCDGEGTDNSEVLFCDPDSEQEPIVDVRRIYKIVLKHVFKAEMETEESVPIVCKLFVSASLFEHSCLSNSTFQVYNDVIAIRTCSFVAKGEEITLRVFDNEVAFANKQTLLRDCGFTCKCALCSLDRQESDYLHDRRSEIFTRFLEMLRGNVKEPSETEERLLPIVKQLEDSYQNRASLKLYLFLAYCQLGKIIDRSKADWSFTLMNYVEKGLESVGLSAEVLLNSVEQTIPHIPQCALFPNTLLEYTSLMAEKEFSCLCFDQVRKWVSVLIMLEQIFRGGNMQMLKDRFKDRPIVIHLLSVYGS